MTLHFPDLENAADIAPSSRRYAARAPRRAGLYRLVGKRILETTFILLALPIVVPLIVCMAVLISLDGGSAFYTQTRVGRNGRMFRMWKLRTMVPDADALLHSYLEATPDAQAEWSATQKLKDDPRITRVGRFLRKASLDELPQLWNVLNGSMSLVGPRPMMVQQQQLYYGYGYYNLRPGITGLWQISDRNHSDFADRVRFDDIYDRMVSLRTDIAVLIRTVSVVLRCTGY